MKNTESRSAALLRLREQHVARGVATSSSVVAARAEGARLWDVDQKEYLDFAAGISVLNVGHSHPRVVEAVRAQLERFTHTCFQVAIYEPYLRVAERLNALAPGDFPKKTVLVTTGAEAVENAVKIARAYTGRRAVIAFTGAFHGRTLLGMSLTGKAVPYRAGFGPMAPEIYRAPYPYEYRGWTAERALAALEEVLQAQVPPHEVAAVIIEPVLGEGGFVPAPPAFLQGVRELTRRHGIVFIADEIQTGFGRTGRWFAVEHSGVVPDLITVAKSLAGGLPLAGVVGRADIMDAVPPGGLGGTYGGNPLACAAALAVLKVFEEERLLERAERLGAELGAALRRMADRYPCIGDVRGLGPMLAMELVRDRERQTPWPELVDRTLKEAETRGLIILKAGLYGNVIRLLPPLTLSDDELRRGLEILETSLARAWEALGGEATGVKQSAAG